jgi:topoisomerase-4 subunit A
MRYTEARLTEVARLLIEGIDEDAVDFRATYDGTNEEPVVLPAAFPNLLATALRVLQSAWRPPFRRTMQLNCATLRCSSLTTRSTQQDAPEIRQGTRFSHRRRHRRYARDNCRSIQYRARLLPCSRAMEAGRYGPRNIRHCYHRNSLAGAEVAPRRKTRRTHQRKKLPLVADVRDESAEDIRLVIEPRSRSVDAELMMESLFKLTELEGRIPLNMNVLVKGRVPQVLGLAEALREWLDHRREVLLRRSKHRLAEIEHRLEVLGGYLVAYLNLDKVIKSSAKRTSQSPF